jgi:hypothetical protein
MKKTFFVMLFVVSNAFAEVSQFEHCNALIRLGMQDINTKLSSDVSNGYNYHKYCRTSRDEMTDLILSQAEASIFGFGGGSGSFNRNETINRLDSFCEENQIIASKSSSLYLQATKYSLPALEAWNQCQLAAKKLVQINLTHKSVNATELVFTIDSTQDGTLFLSGLEYKGYDCKVYKSEQSGLISVQEAKKQNNESHFLDIPINNQNIHISCSRKEASIESGKEVKTLKYEEGTVKIFTTGPMFSITLPEVVEEYHHTPKNSVLAFKSNTCPAGWEPYTDLYGRFIRGLDLNGTIDPGRKLGSKQEDEFKKHNHKNGVYSLLLTNTGKETIEDADNSNEPNLKASGEIQARGGAETRPKNVALLYCIKR